MRVEAGSRHIKIARAGAVLSIIFDRPEKKNALDGAMYFAATKALQSAGSDPSIGAILFAGTGGVFTAGNDLADFLDPDSWEGEFPAFTFIKAVASCETPLVAAIDGAALAATRRLLRGENAAISARIEEEARFFTAALRLEEARAVINAFLSRRR
jgi:enoyl-CoA hydratase/carnithine racemase